jgi:AraC-like DNA-binding protein
LSRTGQIIAKAQETAEASRLVAWSTDGIPDCQRLEFWTDAVSSTLFEMGMATPVKHGFRSFVEAAPLDALVVIALGGSRREAIRGRENIARSSQFSFHILVDFTKPWILKWRGTPVRFEPGDIALTDTRYIHSGYYPEDSIAARHNIKLSPQWLGTWLRNPDRLVGRCIPGGSGWGRALSAFVAQLTPGFALAPPLAPKLLADQLGALLSLVESEQFPAPAAGPSQTRLASKIADTIRQRSSEISLAAQDVATALGVSERTLHRHLKAVCGTFGSYLQESRVDAARRMLESTHLRLLTTAEIGVRAGFGDPSHFARVMHARLGQSPGSYRKAFVSHINEHRKSQRQVSGTAMHLSRAA